MRSHYWRNTDASMLRWRCVLCSQESTIGDMDRYNLSGCISIETLQGLLVDHVKEITGA